MNWVSTGGTICFKPYPLEQALDGIAQAGFRNVELGAVKDFHNHLDPDDCGPARLRQVDAEFRARGLLCVSMSGHAELITQIASVLNTFTGRVPEEDSAHRKLVANVRELADRARDAGVRLCLENDSALMPTAEAGVALLDEIGDDWVQINYDAANVVFYAGASWEDDLRFALPRLGHVHLKDKRGGKGVADFPPLGEGELDVLGLLRELRAAEFEGPVSMEIEFQDYSWPSWNECLAATQRAKSHWDGLMAQLDATP
jgi:sugar phosphate isomerase/epimerase